mgnify:CR=1 FL=1
MVLLEHKEGARVVQQHIGIEHIELGFFAVGCFLLRLCRHWAIGHVFWVSLVWIWLSERSISQAGRSRGRCGALIVQMNVAVTKKRAAKIASPSLMNMDTVRPIAAPPPDFMESFQDSFTTPRSTMSAPAPAPRMPVCHDAEVEPSILGDQIREKCRT